MAAKKVAIVHDWLTNVGGAEKLILSLAKAFPDAPIYTSVYEPDNMSDPFRRLDIRTTWLQKLPAKLRTKHQLFPVLRYFAFRGFDMSEYDIIISSSSAESKAVRKRANATHICYCHTPIRYYWSHYHEYLKNPGLGWLDPLVRLIAPLFIRVMRRFDLKATRGVDSFIANSSAVAERIKKYYHKDATVIYPPVEMQRFRPLDIDGPREGFVALGRQVPYKRIDLAVTACTKLGLPLTVYGDGSEHEKLVAIAGPTVKFVPGASDPQIAEALTRSKALLMPQEEDFGIVQVEAMAAGCPVIALGKDGALDAVVENETGIFFEEQTVGSLSEAIKRFDDLTFDPHAIQQHAENFSEEVFIEKIRDFIADKT